MNSERNEKLLVDQVIGENVGNRKENTATKNHKKDPDGIFRAGISNDPGISFRKNEAESPDAKHKTEYHRP